MRGVAHLRGALLVQHLAHLSRLAASATRSHASLWSRELEMNASRVPSGDHCASHMPVGRRPRGRSRWSGAEVGRHAEPHHDHGASAREVDDHPLDAEHHAVPGQRVLPLLQHSAPPALVRTSTMSRTPRPSCWKVAIRRAVRRPGDAPASVAMHPAGVVGGVAVVLHPVGRQLGLHPAAELLRPEVVVADEHRGACCRARGSRSGGTSGRLG
jgi:hypothetical protein